MKKVAQGVSLLVIFATSMAWAGEINSDSLNRLMTLSGLHKQVAEFPGMVRAGVEQAKQQGSPIPDAEFDKITRSIESAFQPSEILSTIGIELKNSISESEAKGLLAWYESDLGRKITKAEEDASTPAAYQKMIKEAQSLLVDKKRVEIAKKLDGLLNSTDMVMQIQENAGIAVFTAISKAMNPDQPVHIEAFKSQMLAQKQQMRANIEQLVIVTYVYSYKDIDIDSLKKYVEFNERPNTRRFNNSVIKGMKHALNKAIDKMATSLAVTFKKQTQKR
ncbi:MAG: DUF2059 domain-containing protein [Nitrospirae bacterium]|nr:DUF2059 domain-containing protein [Nitrospirota bacterium]